MIPKFKPIILTTVPHNKESEIENPYMVNTTKKGERWGRGKFIALYVGIVLGCALLIMVSSLFADDWIQSYGFLGGMSYIFFIVALIVILLVPISILILHSTACRLRDIGSDPFLAFIFFIPVIGWLQTLYLMFCPGQKGTNKYGPDPRENDDLSENEANKLSKLDILRNYVTHKNTGSQSLQKKQQDECADLLIDKHDVVKKILRTKELLKITKNRDTSGIKSKVVCVGFDSTNSKYYLSVSNVGTPIKEFKRQYFLNYQLMNKALFEQTNILITELANEIS